MDNTKIMRAYKVRLYPNKAQKERLEHTLDACRRWYNMCLEERKWAYQLEGRSVSVYEQKRNIPHYRDTFRLHTVVSNNTLQDVCFTLDKAYKAFFRRIKNGEKPGYPRFKGRDHFDSFGFPMYGSGVKIDGRRVRIFAVGRVRARWDRPVEGKCKTVRIVREVEKWYAVFTCEMGAPEPLPETGRQIGVDVGIDNLMADSNGNTIPNPAWYRSARARLRIAQRKLSRAKRGGKNRKKQVRVVRVLHEKVANQRKDAIGKIVHGLVSDNDLIAIEDLQITNMVRNPHLSQSILDAGWGLFRSKLTYKARDTGRRLVVVNPAYTSQTCSGCGKVHSLKLSDRRMECECGVSLDRDHNAAINILRRAQDAVKK